MTNGATAAPAPQRRRTSRFGPGLIISASFIGPGTVTTATVTGASYGYALGWAIVFSIVATIILQEMAARLGLATGAGLGEAFRAVFAGRLTRLLMAVLVVAAIGIGGGSYAGGDTTGTALAVSSVTRLPQPLVVVVLVALIFALLYTGSYRAIERVLTAMVAAMAVIFCVTALVVRPDPGELLRGLFVPGIPAGALLTAIALIGTTVVPYNVFLHANLARENWAGVQTSVALREARRDTVVSIALGGAITLAIMITAVGSMYVRGLTAERGADLALALEPTLGPLAPWAFALGLFSAGFTSAVAGPLGAAYAICGTLGLRNDLASPAFRAVWTAVLLVGAVIALTGVNPIQIIVLAQAANGLLLPIIATFLLITMNNARLLGRYRNGFLANVLGGLVLLVVTGLALYQFADLFGWLPA